MEEYITFMDERFNILEISALPKLWSAYSVQFQLKPSTGRVCVWTDKADFKFLSGPILTKRIIEKEMLDDLHY